MRQDSLTDSAMETPRQRATTRMMLRQRDREIARQRTGEIGRQCNRDRVYETKKDRECDRDGALDRAYSESERSETSPSPWKRKRG
jgi:hypothetical protein